MKDTFPKETVYEYKLDKLHNLQHEADHKGSLAKYCQGESRVNNLRNSRDLRDPTYLITTVLLLDIYIFLCSFNPFFRSNASFVQQLHQSKR